MKPLRLAILGVLSALLLLSNLGVTEAAPPAKELQGLFGVVSAIRSTPEVTFVTVDTSSGPLEVRALEVTKVWVPSRGSTSVQDVLVGDAVAVFLTTDGEDYRQAIRILVKPEQPVHARHFVGVVTQVEEDGTITLRDYQGNQISAEALEDVPHLQPGELVTAVLNHDPPTGALVITGLERAGDSQDRIQAALKGALEMKASANLEALKTRLADNSARHLSLLQEVSQRVPPGAREGILSRWRQEEEQHTRVLSRWDVGKLSAEVSGVISALDGERRRVTIAPPDLEPVEVSIDSATRIQAQGRDLRWDSLGVGDRALTRYDLQTRAASRILVLPPASLQPGIADILLPMVGNGELTGVVTGVSAGASAATVTIRPTAPTGAAPLTFTVLASSAIWVDGRRAELGAALGRPVSVSFDPAARALVELDTLSPEDPKQKAAWGVVHSFLPKKKEDLGEPLPGNFFVITIDDEVLALHHTRETVIRRDGRQVSINEVRLGDLVRPNTRYLAASKELVLLSLKSPRPASVRGTVQGVATTPQGQHRVTIIGDTLDMITVSVTAETELTRQGKPMRFAEVVVGQRVLQGAYEPTSLKAVSLNLERLRSLRVSGVITDINQAKVTVTITPARGETVQVTVTEGTRITGNGKASARFADLQEGARVRTASYDPDTGEAQHLVIH